MSKPRPINVFKTSAVQKGDILFYYDPYAAKDENISHVAICVDVKDNIPLVAHSARSERINGVMCTYLRSEHSYLVFRCKNNLLAITAADVAYKWTTLGRKIPHEEEKKRGFMNDLYKDCDDMEDAVKKSADLYRQQGFLRALKFAIRDDRPFKIDSLRGFRCDQFVVMCFQVAHLRHLPQYNDSLSTLNDLPSSTQNVSIRKFCENEFYTQAPSRGFELETYIELMKSNEPKGVIVDKEQSLPIISAMTCELSWSLIADKEDREVPNLIIPLDAKRCSPAVLFEFLSNNGSGFGVAGFLSTRVKSGQFPELKGGSGKINITMTKVDHPGGPQEWEDSIITTRVRNVSFEDPLHGLQGERDPAYHQVLTEAIKPHLEMTYGQLLNLILTNFENNLYNCNSSQDVNNAIEAVQQSLQMIFEHVPPTEITMSSDDAIRLEQVTNLIAIRQRESSSTSSGQQTQLRLGR
jgi:hypothetical protein